VIEPHHPETETGPFAPSGRVRLLVAVVSLGLALLALLVLGCASAPAGPPFRWAPDPPPNRGRVYVYRADPRTSLSTVAIKIDGLEIGRFRDRTYETLELPSGSHRLHAGMRGFAFASWGWNEHVFQLRPGDTVFIEISVRLDDPSASNTPPPRDLEIAGRPEGYGSENVFILQNSRPTAEAALATTTRLSAAD